MINLKYWVFILFFILSQMMPGDGQNTTMGQNSTISDLEMQCRMDANLIKQFAAIGGDISPAKQTLRDVLKQTLTARHDGAQENCTEYYSDELGKYYEAQTTRALRAVRMLESAEAICQNDARLATEYGVEHAINNNTHFIEMLNNMFRERRAGCEEDGDEKSEKETMSGRGKSKHEARKAENDVTIKVKNFHEQQLARIQRALDTEVDQRLAGLRAEHAREMQEKEAEWKKEIDTMQNKLESMEDTCRTCKSDFARITDTLALMMTKNDNIGNTCKTELEEMRNATAGMYTKLMAAEVANQIRMDDQFANMAKSYNDTLANPKGVFNEHFANISSMLDSMRLENNNNTRKIDLDKMNKTVTDMFKKLLAEETNNRNRTDTEFAGMARMFNETWTKCEAEGTEDTWKIIGIVFICTTGVLAIIVLILMILVKSKSGCYPVA